MDKPTGKEWVEAHKAELPYYQATRNGYHIFFKAPQNRPSGKRTKAGIDVTYRFHGANQINVAPSPGKMWIVNRLGDLPELPEELTCRSSGKVGQLREKKQDLPQNTSSVQYLSLYGLHIPIYLEDRPRMPMDQSICCRKMTWRLANTPKGERNQTRLELGNLSGSYLLGKSLSFQELRWIAWTAQRHSENPQKAVKEFFQAVNHALAQGVARTYGIDRKALVEALRDLLQGQNLEGDIWVTNETLRAMGFVPSRSMGPTFIKRIGSERVRVRNLFSVVNESELMEAMKKMEIEIEGSENVSEKEKEMLNEVG